MNYSFKSTIFLLASLLFFIGCSDERKTAKNLEAIWSITSYKIFPEDDPEGLEMLGLQFSKGTLVFKSYDLENSIGDFELVLEDAISGDAVLTNGFYMLDEAGEVMSLVIDEAEDNFANVDVSKEELKLEGMIDGVKVKIEGELL